MTTEVIPYRFLVRGGTTAALAAVNEVPLARELVVATDTGRTKVGDGTTPYNDLPYQAQTPRTGFLTAQFDLDGTDESVGVSADLWVPYGFKVLRATLLADVAGSLVIDVRAASFAGYPANAGQSICGGSPPAIAGTDRMQDAALAAWVPVAAPGAAIKFIVTTCAGPRRASLVLEVDRWHE